MSKKPTLLTKDDFPNEGLKDLSQTTSTFKEDLTMLKKKHDIKSYFCFFVRDDKEHGPLGAIVSENMEHEDLGQMIKKAVMVYNKQGEIG